MNAILMHDIACENAAYQNETEAVSKTIERIANAGGFNVTCILSAPEQMKLIKLGYKLTFSHNYRDQWYYIIKW